MNPVDNHVGMPRNSMKAQDGQPERREDSKHTVGRRHSYSNLPDVHKRLRELESCRQFASKSFRVPDTLGVYFVEW